MTLESYIKIYGKPTGLNGNTWNSLAEKFGFKSGEAARSYIKRLNKSESPTMEHSAMQHFVQVGDVPVIGFNGKVTSATGWIQIDNKQKQRPDIAPTIHASTWQQKVESLIQKNTQDTVLVIPDLHIPAQHKDALEFCKSLRDKYKATKVIFIGDIVDNYCTSLHSKDPNFSMTASQEIEVTKMYLKEWHDAFPYATVITGNHDMSRIFKTAKEAMIPKQWLKDIKDVLDTPTWTYTPELVHQGVYYNHGEKAEASKVAIYRGMSTVQGHRHTLSYVQWVKKDVFACQVGTLVDRDSMVFDYAKNTYLDWWNGACIIQDGVPTLIPLK